MGVGGWVAICLCFGGDIHHCKGQTPRHSASSVPPLYLLYLTHRIAIKKTTVFLMKSTRFQLLLGIMEPKFVVYVAFLRCLHL